jgi:hypothetical protein
MEQIWANIIDNWEILIYLSGLIVSFVFGRKKTLTEDEKQKIKLAKAHKKTNKAETKYKKALGKEIELQGENENASNASTSP